MRASIASVEVSTVVRFPGYKTIYKLPFRVCSGISRALEARRERRLDRIFTKPTRISRIVLIVVLLLLRPKTSATAEEWKGSDYGWLLTGAATGFILHEGAHALMAESLGFDARLESRGKPIPFVVVRYDLVLKKDVNGHIRYTDKEGNPISNGAQKQYAIASAGINSQNITSEIILTLHPDLREERRPFFEGCPRVRYDCIGRLCFYRPKRSRWRSSRDVGGARGERQMAGDAGLFAGGGGYVSLLLSRFPLGPLG